ncbi:MAG: tetratricopeptide repeat protein, partial [Polyangiaceae bacterium]
PPSSRPTLENGATAALAAGLMRDSTPAVNIPPAPSSEPDADHARVAVLNEPEEEEEENEDEEEEEENEDEADDEEEDGEDEDAVDDDDEDGEDEDEDDEDDDEDDDDDEDEDEDEDDGDEDEDDDASEGGEEKVAKRAADDDSFDDSAPISDRHDDLTTPSVVRASEQNAVVRQLVAGLIGFIVFALIGGSLYSRWQDGQVAPKDLHPAPTAPVVPVSVTPPAQPPPSATPPAVETVAVPTVVQPPVAHDVAPTHAPEVVPAPGPPVVAPPVTNPTPPDVAPPTAKGTLIQQAQHMLERGNAAGAIDLARRATDKDPTDAEAWLTLGAAYDTAGNHAKARTAYQSCIDKAQGARVSECRALLGQ